MIQQEIKKSVGQPLDRVEGRAKVTGTARYPSEFPLDNLAHAVVVQSTIANGRIRTIDTSAAEAATGVLAILTYRNAPRLHPADNLRGLATPPVPPLQDEHVYYHGQHVALVIAETLEQATFAATLVSIDYEEKEALLSLDDERAQAFGSTDPDDVRGDPDAALATADVRIDSTYTTPTQHHNPMALFATTANWDGKELTLYDTTQGVGNVRAAVAGVLGLELSQVRVIAPYIGGAFGSGLRVWPHVVIAAMATQHIGRPVKLVLAREHMYTAIGYRPQTVQRVALGATREGQIVATIHEALEPTSMVDNYQEGPTQATALMYASPNLRLKDQQKRLNVSVPTWMRGPGEAQGLFALEMAMDELAYALKCDPIALRLRNIPQVHPVSGLPWSSHGLRECYERGAEQFGWERRTLEPRSMRDGKYLVGWGVASSYFPYIRLFAQARVRILSDGDAQVKISSTDLGTGTYTIMTQIAADALGLAPERVHCELGDSSLPDSPASGGSALAASVGSAVHAAATKALTQVLALISDDAASPLQGATSNDVIVSDGRIELKHDPAKGETYAAILQRHNMQQIEALGEAASGDEMKQFGTAVFGAKFVEVRIDPDLGSIQIARVLSVVDAGRILNEKTARSQMIGGAVGGIGMALLEETLMETETGRIVNANLADYVVPVHADIPPIDVLFVGEPDTKLNPIGSKGIGEISLIGMAPAIGNAIYHATGRRVRDLPITMDKLL